jgi:lipopolysaccharide heptosyltransferase I
MAELPIRLDGCRRLLLVKPSALGDVVHTLPVVATLKRRYPDLALDWLVEEEASAIVAGHPAVARVLVSGRRRWLRDVRHPGRLPGALREFRAFFRELHKARYDVVLDLQGLLKSALYTLAAGAPIRVGFAEGREGAPRVLTHRVVAPAQPVHAVRRYLALAAALDASEPVWDFTIPIRAEDRTEAEAALAGLPAPRVVLHPGARWPTKCWEPPAWRQLAASLAADGAGLVITGGPEDAPLAEAIAAVAPGRARSVAGRLPLKALAALLARVDLVVTVDSGPMHIAAAARAPIVALFGPTDPRRTGPFGPATVLRRELTCSPCLKRQCAIREERQCMRALSAAEVLAAARAALAAPRGRNELEWPMTESR